MAIRKMLGGSIVAPDTRCFDCATAIPFGGDKTSIVSKYFGESEADFCNSCLCYYFGEEIFHIPYYVGRKICFICEKNIDDDNVVIFIVDLGFSMEYFEKKCHILCFKESCTEEFLTRIKGCDKIVP